MGRKDKAISQENADVIPVGMRLRYVRQGKKISLSHMAERLSYTKGYLSSVENGNMKVSEDLVRRYEEELGLEPGELNELVQALRAPVSRTERQVWYMPYPRNIFFTGREALLENIRNGFINSRIEPHILAITGLAGVGKSQLAAEYAYRYRKEYRAVLWLSADSSEDLATSCTDLANHLDLPEKSAQNRKTTVNVVQRWIGENTGSLVIIDNVDDLQAIYDFLLQLGSNHILLSTRTQAVGAVAQNLDLEEMNPEESMLLLLRRAKIISLGTALSSVSESIQVQARDISEVMGGLPLALAQAGSYIEETGCGLPGYLHLLEQQRKRALSSSEQISTRYYASVANTWALSLEKIKQVNVASAELLYLCAFLNSDRIYEDFLIAGADALGPTFQHIANDPFELHRAIGELRKYSLVRTDSGSGALSIHRLVQAVIRDMLEPEVRHLWLERTVMAVNRAFPVIKVATWHETWARCQRYSPQAEGCAELIDQWGLVGEDATQLLRKLGKYFEERTQLNDAERLYYQALKVGTQFYGEEHVSIMEDFVNLAMLYTRQAKYEKALELYKKALFIQDKVGLELLDVDVLKNYVSVLRQMNREDEAKLWGEIGGEKYTRKLQEVLKRRPVNDDDESISYNEEDSWTQQKHSGDYNNDAHFTNSPGASFEYRFDGVGIEIISDTSSVHGEVEIYIDDMYQQTVNTLRLSNQLTQTIIFGKTNLESGLHTLKVVLVNGAFILDALAVFFYEKEAIMQRSQFYPLYDKDNRHGGNEKGNLS